MGDEFPKARAKEALENCGGNLESAANWIFSNPLPARSLVRISTTQCQVRFLLPFHQQ